MHENCGVVAVIDLAGEQDVVPLTVAIAEQLQHRGEVGAGISWLEKQEDTNAIRILKDHGLVREVLTPERLRAANAKGTAAIAHTRYATNTHLQRCMVQPYGYTQEGANMDFLMEHNPDSGGLLQEKQELPQSFSFAFNGNIANHAEMTRLLGAIGEPVCIEGDTEIIGRTIIDSWRKRAGQKMGKVLQPLSQLDGAFNIVMLQQNGSINALRDPHAFHPLSYARNGSLVAVASEDHAIRHVWPNAKIGDIEAGQLLQALPKTKDIAVDQLWMADKNHCFFEWIYFADHRSRIDGRSVANVRYECGKILAEMDSDRPDTDIVVPVPESAKIASNGYTDTRKLPRIDGILKNPLVGRSFIGKDKSDREKKAEMKYNIDGGFLRGRNIVLIDDSLVRGTTMKVLVQRLKDKEVGGVKEVHLRLASPPIIAPCFYGIDFPTVQELLVRKYSDGTLTDGMLPDDVLRAMARDLGVDSLKYLPVDAIPRALGKEKDSICMACITQQYPTDEGTRLHVIAEHQCKCERKD